MVTQSLQSQATDSYWTRFKNCLGDRSTIQNAKMAIYYTGSMASVFIPVPYLNGALQGGLMFLGNHAAFQHPSSICMQMDQAPLAQSRTWKHLTAGGVIAAAGGVLALATTKPFLIFLGLFGGAAISLKVAYSDFFCQGNYTLVAQNDHQPLLEEATTQV